jgi:hypothetical protein
MNILLLLLFTVLIFQVNAWMIWGEFLYRDISSLCATMKDFEYRFWYIWASCNATKTGFLIDFVKTPNNLELRLELFDDRSKNQSSIKQLLPLSLFKQYDPNWVNMWFAIA